MEKRIPGLVRCAGGLLAAMLLTTVAGCGNSTTVTGRVTYGGRAVTYGSVVFVGPDKTARSAAIEPDGSYTVEGLPPGEYRIAVISRDPSKGRSVLRNRKPDPPGRPGAARQPASAGDWFPLPEQLESPSTSGLRRELGAGHVNYDIEMKCISRPE